MHAESRKMVTDEPISRAGLETDIENGLWPQWGSGRVGWIDSDIDTCTLPCVK